jgi:hypothetical protein
MFKRINSIVAIIALFAVMTTPAFASTQQVEPIVEEQIVENVEYAEIAPRVDTNVQCDITTGYTTVFGPYMPGPAQTIKISYSANSANAHITSVSFKITTESGKSEVITCKKGEIKTFSVSALDSYRVWAKSNVSSGGTIQVSVKTQ